MPSGTISTVMTAMLEKSRRKLMFAAIKSHALMAWAFASNQVEYETGGATISNPLIVGRNPNVTSFQYYDSLPVTQTDEFDKVEYGWARVAGTLIMSEQEQDENRGPEATFKILKGKLDVLEESIKEKYTEYFYGLGAGTDPYGLPALIPADPTTGSLGSISMATQVQWRTSAYDFSAGLDETNIEEAFDDILLDLSQKSDKPSIAILGRNLYRYYRGAVRDKMVLNISDTSNGKRMVDLGFTGVKHQGVNLVYDEDCPVDEGYFINDKYIKLHILKHVNMRVKDLVAPWTVDAIGKRIVWQGQFCRWLAYRKHAFITN